MIKRFIAAITLAAIISPAWAMHFAAYRALCATDSGGYRPVSVYIYDPGDTMDIKQEWHGASEIFDPQTGVRAWLEEKLGPGWEKHWTTTVDKVMGRCPEQIGS